MSEIDAVLSQNLEFYRAFSTQDVAAMERLWARDAPVTCIHPGWALLTGRDDVMTSWRAIMTGPTAPVVLCYEEAAHLYGNVAVVTCEEEIGADTLAATNMFAKENGLWRLIHHQAATILKRVGKK